MFAPQHTQPARMLQLRAREAPTCLVAQPRLLRCGQPDKLLLLGSAVPHTPHTQPTVIFVAMEGSMMAAHSCAAKMRRGSCLKSVTLTNPLRQKRDRRCSASSRESRRSRSYL